MDVNAGKYAMHGSYGVDSGFISIELFTYFFDIMTDKSALHYHFGEELFTIFPSFQAF